MNTVHRSPATTAAFRTLLSRLCLTLPLFASMAAATTQARAQWVTVNLHPDGARFSQLYGGRDGIQVGQAILPPVGDTVRSVAAMWRGTSASFVNLAPPSWSNSNALGVFGSRIVVWSDPFVGPDRTLVLDISTPIPTETVFGSSGDTVNPTGIFADRVVGSQNNRASLWSGPSLTWSDLTPLEASAGCVSGAGELHEVGGVMINQVGRAAMWSGTRESWVDLHPEDTLGSGLIACDASSQVGFVLIEPSGPPFAAVWRGNSDSFVSLNPQGAIGSVATGVLGEIQVGWVQIPPAFPLRARAAIWFGSAVSYVDLHQFLPVEYSDSFVTAIYEDVAAGLRVVCGTAWIGGYSTGVSHAFIWTQPLGDPCAFSQQPQPTQVGVGAAATFTATFARSDQSLRWRRNGVPLSDSARYSGTESSTLTIQNIGNTDQALYDLVATGTCGTMISDAAELSCKPIILDQPTGRIVLQSPLQLRLTVPQGVSYTYRWRQNGQNLFNFPGFISGATTPTLNLLVEDESLLGTFDCVLTNVCGTTTTVPFRVVSICDYDFNQDENVDLSDAQQMAQVFVGLLTSEAGWLDGDLNGDENADLTDAQQLANYVVMGICGV